MQLLAGDETKLKMKVVMGLTTIDNVETYSRQQLPRRINSKKAKP
jgi:hypothetical protein